MTDGRPLDGQTIRSIVLELADALPEQEAQRSIVLVGGALLAWHGLRDSTVDVDSVRHLDRVLRGAIETVAVATGLPPWWLNDDAAMFLPANFDESHCTVLLDHPRLLVLGVSFRDLFVMKLYRSFPNDVADMVVIWERTGFRYAQEVVDAFFAAYPHAPDDEFLANFVVDVAARAGVTIPLG